MGKDQGGVGVRVSASEGKGGSGVVTKHATWTVQRSELSTGGKKTQESRQRKLEGLKRYVNASTKKEVSQIH